MHPPVYCHEKRGITVAVHVDESMCLGAADELTWLFNSVDKQYDLKRPGSKKEVKYSSRLLRRWGSGIEWACDSKHARTLVTRMTKSMGKGACGMAEYMGKRLP